VKEEAPKQMKEGEAEKLQEEGAANYKNSLH
jgi:hypothetical protein